MAPSSESMHSSIIEEDSNEASAQEHQKEGKPNSPSNIGTDNTEFPSNQAEKISESKTPKQGHS